MVPIQCKQFAAIKYYLVHIQYYYRQLDIVVADTQRNTYLTVTAIVEWILRHVGGIRVSEREGTRIAVPHIPALVSLNSTSYNLVS